MTSDRIKTVCSSADNKVAPLGATLSEGATDEDWALLPWLSLPCWLYVALFSTLETTYGAIATLTYVVPTARSTCRIPVTFLCHSTLRLGRPSFNVLEFWLLYSPLFVGTGALADDLEGPFCLCWKNEKNERFACITSLLPRFTSYFSLFVPKLLPVPQFLFLILRHLRHQPCYIHVSN